MRAVPDHIVQVGVGGGDEIPVLQEAFPEAKFTGIDPDDGAAALWQENYPGEYIKAVCGAKHGSQTRYHSARAWRFRLDRKGAKVPVVSLDGLLGAFRGTPAAFTGKVLLWMDCDGGELPVLRGAQEFMRECVFAAWLEETEAPQESTWVDATTICHEMKQLGFKPTYRAGAWFPPRYCADTLYVRRST